MTSGLWAHSRPLSQPSSLICVMDLEALASERDVFEKLVVQLPPKALGSLGGTSRTLRALIASLPRTAWVAAAQAAGVLPQSPLFRCALWQLACRTARKLLLLLRLAKQHWCTSMRRHAGVQHGCLLCRTVSYATLCAEADADACRSESIPGFLAQQNCIQKNFRLDSRHAVHQPQRLQVLQGGQLSHCSPFQASLCVTPMAGPQSALYRLGMHDFRGSSAPCVQPGVSFVSVFQGDWHQLHFELQASCAGIDFCVLSPDARPSACLLDGM